MITERHAEIRRVIGEHAGLAVGLDTVADDTDLFGAGMTSHASVNVMLALEDAFDLEFPTGCSGGACSRVSTQSPRPSRSSQPMTVRAERPARAMPRPSQVA
jgi:acyl carrier protein